MKFLNKKTKPILLYGLIVFWIILWANFIGRDLIKRKQLKDYMILAGSNAEEKYALAVAIRQWQQMTYIGIEYRAWRHIMALSTILTIPPTVVYFFTQRYFVQGPVISGIKG